MQSTLQIVIPMSGFGERFRRAGYKVPKPLIEVAGRPIIAYVADLFPDESDVTFICNEDHLADPAFNMLAILRSIRPSARIVGIPAHHQGPVHAVSKIFDVIRDDAPVIVNYCDFTCYWNYEHFKKFVRECGCDGAIPAYCGFHPHSLGSTFYAYLRQQNGWASDIQEKKPFTDKPLEEFASSGTYYFASGALMKHAFRETERRNINVGGEYYVSLAYKTLFEQKKRVAVYDLQHFMQWGTPEDIEEYLQYDRTFRELTKPVLRSRHEGALLIPMAGAGARFSAAGYAEPKPLISVSGRPMALAATDDLPQTDRQVFVLRRDLPHFERVECTLRDSYPDCRIVVLDNLTDGQAVTCLAALDQVDLDKPLTIGACDTGLIYNPRVFQALMQDDSTDVIVWGFRGHQSARRRPVSYGWIDADDGVVKAVAVKTPLRDPATDPVIVGAFTFKRAADFKAAAERMLARKARINGEYYVDTCMNDAVALGLKVRMFEVNAYLCWGTPEELKIFNYWQSCFHKWDGHPYQLSKDGRVPVSAIAPLECDYAPIVPPLPIPLYGVSE